MSINIGDKPEMNVVNVGDELTTDQLAALQNAQGASATNPVLTRTNTFNTTDTAVRITQEGTGDAFRIEDETNPDSSPFVINSNGSVGIGLSLPTSRLHVNGGTHITAGSTIVPILQVAQSNIAAIATFTNTALATADAVRITNLGTGNSFVVEDDTNPDASPFVIDANGNVGIGTASIGAKLVVNGGAIFSGISGGTLYNFTQNGTGTLAVFANNATSTADAVRITNTGTGNSLVVEDDTNPDVTPFVITNNGNVGVGTASPTAKLTVAGSITVNGGGTLFNVVSGSSIPVTITNSGTGNSFVVNDESGDTTQFVIDNAGNVTLGGSLTLASGAYAANAALVIDNTNYPHELEFKVGATTYRVPARAI